jgi:PKD repeat protein
LEITFDNLTVHKDTLQTYIWNFGDGTPPITHSTNQPINHIFYQSNQFSSKLTAIDIHGCTDSITQQVNIRPSPIADFINSEVCEGTEVSFADNSSTLPYNPVQTYLWTFDTTQSSNQTPNPNHLFSSSGFYKVSLKTISLNGCWDTITKFVQVHSFPLPNYIYDSVCVNNLTDFYDNSSVLNDSITSWHWTKNENDNNIFIANPYLSDTKISISDTLKHKINLKVSSNFACESTISKLVKSHSLPKALFTTDKEYGLPPLEVQFYNQSTPNNLTYLWSFGDNNQSIIYSPTHIYTDSAIFHPLLKTTNQFGCWDTISHPVYVIYAAVDVAITDVLAEVDNGYISYSCNITNYGKQKLKNLILYAKYNSGIEVSEEWNGELLSGATVSYEFKSKTKIPPNEQIRYYCITAETTSSASQEDENLNNNTLCKDISSDFWIGQTYPNPTNGLINIDIVLPFSQEVNIQLFNINGNKVNNYSFKGNKGLNQFYIDVNKYKSGNYYLQIDAGENKEIRKFVRL